MIERVLIGATLAALLAGLYLISGDQSEAERQFEQYCEMVQIWHDTNGESGWPPYKGEDQC